jgi:hypothetical protein
LPQWGVIHQPPMTRVSPLALLAVLLLTACGGIRSSVVATGATVAPYQGPVQVRATGAPSTPELGLVQVAGQRTVDDLMPEFKRRVAELGGSLGIVDQVKSRFEMIMRTQMQTYSCGTQSAPRTCTRTQHVWVEVMTVQLLGRAFRS